MEQYKPNLGELAGVDARRDAVHIAVAPMIAGERLYPGQQVGLQADGRAVVFVSESLTIGIVDPFFPDGKTPIEPGERFWLFLYPNSITNLRHVWEHPAFKAKLPDVRPVYPVTEES